MIVLCSTIGVCADQAENQEELSQQVSELASGDYEDRERAASQLAQAGAEAVPLLESCAEADNLEARIRSLRLLQQIYETNDFVASFAAGDALRRLAVHQQRLVASFAKDALSSQPQLAMDRLKSKGAAFQSDNTVVELGSDWKGLPADVMELRWCDSVRVLRLSKPELDDRAVAVLRWMPNVTELVIFDAQITDAGLEQLRHSRQLKVLHLARTPVTDSGLSHVGKLNSLTYLDLSRSQITGNGLPHLHRLSKLRQLDLRGVSLPEEAVNQLRKQLPKARLLVD